MYLSVRNVPDPPVSADEDLPPERPTSRFGGVFSRNVVALGITSLLTDISSEMVVAILPLYLTVSLGLSTVAFGFFEGAYKLVGAAFRLVGGATADRTQNHKAVAASGYALSAATRIGLIASTAVTVPIIPILLLERVGKGIRSAPRDALISLSTAPNRLGAAFGVHRSMDTIGATVGPFMAFVVLAWSADSYRSIFVVSLAFAVLGVMVITTFADPKPQAAQPSPSATISDAVSDTFVHRVLRPSRAALAQPGVRRIAVIAWTLGLVTVSDGFVYLIIQRHTTMRIGLFPLLFAGTGLVYLLLAIPMGWLADRVGRRRVFVAGHTCTLALYLLLAVGAGREAFDSRWVLVGLTLLGTYYAATDGVLSAAASAVSDASSRSSAIAVVTVAAAMGGLVSAVGFGLAWSRFGSQDALVIMAVLLAGALPISWRLLGQSDGHSMAGGQQ